MPQITVRTATRADGETILRLIDGLAAYEKLPPPDAEGRARFLADLERDPPLFRTLIAEADGVAVGYTVTCVTYSTFRARPKLFLEDIFVVEEARRSGAGFALFRACVDEASQRGCSALQWEVLDWNKLALDFYDRLGGKPFDGWLAYRLDREGMRLLLDRE